MLKLEAEIEQIKKDHLDQEKSLSENQRELNQLVGKIRALENDKRLLAQQRTFVEQNLKKFQDQVLISQNNLTELRRNRLVQIGNVAGNQIGRKTGGRTQ